MRRLLTLLCLLLGACTTQPARIPSGEHPTIVSLNPCTDAILAEVADPGQLLAISHYSQEPRASSMPLTEARRFRATGGTVEEVLALDPDVVVASAFLAPASAQAFARLGIPVETFGTTATVTDSEGQICRLARLAGHPERGEALIARIDASLAAGRWPGKPVTALLWEQGGIVAGNDTLIAQLMANAGFASQSAARGLGQGASLPLERVLADPPRAILAAGGERPLTHPALRKLAGVRYAALDPALLYCGGPTIVRAAQRLAEVRRSIG